MSKRVFGWAAALLTAAILQSAVLPEARPVQKSTGSAAAATAHAAQDRPSSPAAAPPSRPVLDQYCVTCHNDRMKTGGLSLQGVNIARAGEHGAVLEKVVRKLRAGAMPPLGAPRPDRSAMDRFVASVAPR